MNDLIRRQDVQRHYPYISVNTLKRLAVIGEGPEYVIIGRDAYYKSDDIKRYIDQKTIKPDLESRRKRKIVSEILEGSPVRRKPGRPRKQPTQPAA